MQERQWITARRSELVALAEQLTKQLQEVQVERDELAIAERVLNRSSDCPAQYPYNAVGTSALNDVTSGSNGSCCTSHFCTGTSGYDGPTLGHPRGPGRLHRLSAGRNGLSTTSPSGHGEPPG
ncbi:hypothetical protein [Streptomyces sp. NPDC001315]|uniref:hypothetical protein n=1 Tax=Streptomyces sp. NPDC001315 TaxID=3364562 RepID=UPI0036B9B0F8